MRRAGTLGLRHDARAVGRDRSRSSACGGAARRCDVAARTAIPAARDVGPLEILATWPGVHALLAHRVAHALHDAGVPLLPRLIASCPRSVTGIEIHPAAKIGRGSSSTTGWAW